MLLIARNMEQLSFGKLMEIYVEGNLEYGQMQAPDLSRERQIALGEEAFREYLHDRFFPLPGAFYAVWQEDDAYVSALRLLPNRDGLLLEALETAPAHRRKGYAAALIRAVLDDVGAGKIYSHVSKSNEASLAVHRACGFSVYLDYAQRADGSVMDHIYTLCREIGEKNGTGIY